MGLRHAWVMVFFLLDSAGVAGGLARELAGVLPAQSVGRFTREELLGLDDEDLLATLRARDPYARYLSPQDYAALRMPTQKVGIGVQLFEDHGRLLLVPYPNGPAFQAGLLGRTRLLRIEGRQVTGEPLERVARRMQGVAGSVVRIEVSVDDGETIQGLAVKRAPFTTPAAAYVEEDDLALLRIWSFRTRETVVALRTGLKRMRARDQPIVIDLRDAQGGDLFEALDATSLFLDGGLSVAAVDYIRSGRKDYLSLPKQRLIRQQVILLVGQSTASAAEAFARALRWYGAALLVGETTYGKCLTQTLVPLRNGGALAFSNGQLLGPGGSPCETRGLTPDIQVARATERSVRSLLLASADWLRRRLPDGS